MKKDVKSGLIVFIVLLCLIGLVTTASILSGKKGSPSISISTSGKSNQIVLEGDYDRETLKTYRDEYVAALYIEGVIEEENQNYSQKWLLPKIKELKNDSKNQGLVIFMQTPGGAVYQSDEVYLALQDYKTSGKKIFVYMGTLAASGGYYISCAANEIWANRNTLTGSIGVISAQFIDISGLLADKGIKTAIVHSGKNKAMGHMTEPFTSEQINIMQSICDECYEQFTSIVANGRNMSKDEVYPLADGRIYTARQALENKLIDRIDTFENCLSYFTEKVIEKPGIRIETFKKEKKTNFRDYLTGQISDLLTKETAAKSGIPASALKELEGFNSYPAYLYVK